MGAHDDIARLRDEQGRASSSIDWERVLTHNYRGYIDRGGVVIDVGAHNGMHSRRVRRYLRPAQLILVEPIPELAAGLRREFGRRRNVEVREVALSTEPGTATFVVDDTAPGESGLENRADALGRDHQTREIEVSVQRIDDWTLEGPLSYMKVDVEGGEINVVRGASGLVTSDRPILSLEFGNAAAAYGQSDADLVAFADDHDLAILDLLGNEIPFDDFGAVAAYYWDFLLVPRERLAAMADRRAAVRAAAFRSIENFNPTIERWKKRLRF